MASINSSNIPLGINITADTGNAVASITGVANAFNKADSSVVKAAAGFDTFKDELIRVTDDKEGVIAVTTALGNLSQQLNDLGFNFSASIDLYREFTGRIAEVSTLLGSGGSSFEDLQKQMEGLNEQVRVLATTFGQDAVTQAAALYQTISSGVTGAADAMQVLTAANKLAVGGATDVFTAVDGLTSVMNAYAISSSQVSNISDTMFVTMKDGKTTIKELSDNIGNVAGIAAQAGLGFDELMASIATITLSGKSTAEAITAVRGALTAMMSPSVEATQTAEQLGLDFSTAAIRADGFAGTLKKVTDATGGSETLLASLYGNIRGLAGVMSLTGTNTATFARVLEDLKNKTGASDEAVGKMSQTFDVSMKRLGTAVDEVQIRLGTVLGPVVKNVADVFTVILNSSGGVAATLTALGAAAAGVVAPIGAVTAAGVGLGTVFQSLMAGMFGLNAQTTQLVPSTYSLAAAQTANTAANQATAASSAELVVARKAYAIATAEAKIAAEALAAAQLAEGNSSKVASSHTIAFQTALAARAAQTKAVAIIDQITTSERLAAVTQLSLAEIQAGNSTGVATLAVKALTAAKTTDEIATVILEEKTIELSIAEQAATLATNEQILANNNLAIAKAGNASATKILELEEIAQVATNRASDLQSTKTAISFNIEAAAKAKSAAASQLAASEDAILVVAQNAVGVSATENAVKMTAFQTAMSVMQSGPVLFAAALAGVSYAIYNWKESLDVTTLSLSKLQETSRIVSGEIDTMSFDVAKQNIASLREELELANKTQENMQGFFGKIFYDSIDLAEVDNKIKIINTSLDELGTRQQAIGTKSQLLAVELSNVNAKLEEAKQASNGLFGANNQQDIELYSQKQKSLSDQLDVVNRSLKTGKEIEDAVIATYEKKRIAIERETEVLNTSIAVVKAKAEAETAQNKTSQALADLSGEKVAKLKLEAEQAQANLLVSQQLSSSYLEQANLAQANLEAKQKEMAGLSEAMAKTLQQDFDTLQKLADTTKAKAEASQAETEGLQVVVAQTQLAIQTYGDQSASVKEVQLDIEKLSNTHAELNTRISEQQGIIQNSNSAFAQSAEQVKLASDAVTDAKIKLEELTAKYSGIEASSQGAWLAQNALNEAMVQAQKQYTDAQTALELLSSSNQSNAESYAIAEQAVNKAADSIKNIQLEQDKSLSTIQNNITANQELQDVNKTLEDATTKYNTALDVSNALQSQVNNESNKLSELKKQDTQTTIDLAAAHSRLGDSQKDLIDKNQGLLAFFADGNTSIENQSRLLHMLASDSQDAANNVKRLEQAQADGITASNMLASAQQQLKDAQQQLSNAQKSGADNVEALRQREEALSNGVNALNEDIRDGALAESQLEQARIKAAAAAALVTKAAQEEQNRIQELSDDLGRELGLRETQLDIKNKSIKNEIELAKAKGDTEKVSKLEQESLKNEIASLKDQAQVKQQQADLAYASAEAKKTEALADGEYTAAEQAAVDAILDSAKAMELQAQSLTQDAEIKSQGVESTNEFFQALRDGKDAGDDFKKQVNDTASIAKMMADEINAAYDSLSKYSEAAANAARATMEASSDWVSGTNQVSELAKAAGNFIDVGNQEKFELTSKVAEFTAGVESAKAAVKGYEDNAFHADLAWKPFWSGMSNIAKFEQALAEAALASAKLDLAQSNLGDKIDDVSKQFDKGDLSLVDYKARLESLRASFGYLGDERLEDLNAALKRANDEVQSMTDSVQGELISALSDADGVLGEFSTEIENLKYEQTKAELEIQLLKAEGNAKLEAQIKRVMEIREALHEKTLNNIEAENRARQNDDTPIRKTQDAYKELNDEMDRTTKTAGGTSKAFVDLNDNISTTSTHATYAAASLSSLGGAMGSVSSNSSQAGNSLNVIQGHLDRTSEHAATTTASMHAMAASIKEVHDEKITGSGLADVDIALDSTSNHSIVASKNILDIATAIKDVHDTSIKGIDIGVKGIAAESNPIQYKNSYNSIPANANPLGVSNAFQASSSSSFQSQNQPISKTVKLELTSGKALYGDESAVNSLLDQLQRHGMVSA